MIKLKKEKIRYALKQLDKEKSIYCKMYKKCNACPNLLEGGFCEIKLAMKELRNIQNKIC